MTSKLLGARALREMLEREGLHPKKRYGQNFVVDPNTIRKVLDVAALDPDAHVLEIGAGVGSLTLGLASSARKVTAVEVDARLIPLLENSLAGTDNVEVVHADVMRMDLSSVEADAVVSNLPYNLAASIVLNVLHDAPSVSTLTVMAQREVGMRLAASPGSKTYGQTSVLVAFHATATVAIRVSRNAFFPVPDVDSVLVRIERHGTPDVDAPSFRRIVKSAFEQRRKTLRNSLSGMAGDISAAFDAAGVPPTARAEDLDVDGYVALTRALS